MNALELNSIYKAFGALPVLSLFDTLRLDANVEAQAPTGWICGAFGKSPARWVK